MGLDLDYMEGQTPLEDDEKEGLLIPTIATRGELDEFEQQNIEDAVQWALGLSVKPELIFTEKFIKNVHIRMYGRVWSWAGTFRRTNKNISVDKCQIPSELKQLLDDAGYWYANATFLPDEMAVRFKHRLVSIHCFPNGNCRHSRLMADIIIDKGYGLPPFTWGAGSLLQAGNTRTIYLNAVRAADRGDYAPLLAFARS